MSVQPENPIIHSPNAEFSVIATPNKRYEAFHVPFSERRVLLMFVDIMFLLLAVFAAFIWWQQSDSDTLSISYILDRWYWFPFLSGGSSCLAQRFV